MELLAIKQKICSALHSEQYSRCLRKIAIEDCKLTDFVALLDDIVDEQHLHSPKV